MDRLSKLFSSGTLVKVMRLFLFNPEEPFDNEDISRKIKSSRSSVSYEAKLLHDVGFLKPKTFSKTVTRKQGNKRVERKKKTKGWLLNQNFDYLPSLKTLLINTELMEKGDIEDRLSKVGRMKLIAASGVFVQEPDRRVDLLLVGERINPASLSSAVKAIESIIGNELRYAVFSPEAFEYRVSVQDRLIRDVFDYPHLLVLNRIKGLDLRSSDEEPLV